MLLHSYTHSDGLWLYKSPAVISTKELEKTYSRAELLIGLTAVKIENHVNGFS